MSTALQLGQAGEAELPPIIAESAAMKRAVVLARTFAPGDLPILIVAPTGCGKELLAQHIHRWSGWRGELVDINCAALPEHLFESELFGHDGQAYTGARREKPGLIEVANAGSLFLDEVGSFPTHLQPKLLRVLETGELRRVGETAKRRVCVRIVAAAQDDLQGLIQTGAFRRDLYQRLAGVVLVIPPLAQRPQDVLALARHFGAVRRLGLAPSAEPALLEHSWPGNVRELQQVLERSISLAADDKVTGDTIREAIALGTPGEAHSPPPSIVAESPPDADTPRTRCQPRGVLPPVLERTLNICRELGWNGGRASLILRINRTTLYRRLRKIGLSLRQQKNYAMMRNDAQQGASLHPVFKGPSAVSPGASKK